MIIISTIINTLVIFILNILMRAKSKKQKNPDCVRKRLYTKNITQRNKAQQFLERLFTVSG